jgi:DHA2 family multidrug resistance protein
MAKGMTPDVALNAAYKSMDYVVTKQASVLSYMDAFLALGGMFLICIPFVLMVKNSKAKKVDLSEAMH